MWLDDWKVGNCKLPQAVSLISAKKLLRQTLRKSILKMRRLYSQCAQCNKVLLKHAPNQKPFPVEGNHVQKPLYIISRGCSNGISAHLLKEGDDKKKELSLCVSYKEFMTGIPENNMMHKVSSLCTPKMSIHIHVSYQEQQEVVQYNTAGASGEQLKEPF